MGEYVLNPPSPAFEWGNATGISTPSSPYLLVNEKFNATMEVAEGMLERLVGESGNGGYLGTLNSIIEDYSAPAITPISLDIPGLDVTIENRPTPDLDSLDTDFPSFDVPPPSLAPLPIVDLSGLAPADLPEELEVAIAWAESAHDTTLYTELLSRLVADLQSGATGIPSDVEQEIYDRALARQAIENDRVQREIEDYFSTRGFDLPPGAMAGRLQEQANEISRNNTELNGKIMIEQAELAQKNSQFVIQAAATLESVLRDYSSKKNDRSLDYAKAVAAHAVAIYSENVRAYIAAAEANKAYVEVQVENLRSVVEYNKGLVALFASEAEAYGVVIEAKAKKNEAITESYKTEVIGYDAETRAIAENKKVELGAYGLMVQAAELELRRQIAELENTLGGYSSESSLREKVAESMANIAMQAVASAYGAVNASAGLSYSGSESLSESVNHSSSRSDSYVHSESLNESHTYEEE